MGVRYSQLQARQLTGVSVETLRHWRKVLPSLGDRKGRSATFSFPDLVGLSAIRVAVEAMGIGVARLANPARSLFGAQEQARWTRPGIKAPLFVVWIHGSERAQATFLRGAVVEGGEGLNEITSAASALVVVPLAPLLQELRSRVLLEEEPSLPFPPLPLQQRSATNHKIAAVRKPRKRAQRG
jgi:hypothetical protein